MNLQEFIDFNVKVSTELLTTQKPLLTHFQTKQILKDNSNYSEWCDLLNKQLPKYNVTTKEDIARFLSQVCHESRNLTILKENLNYSSQRLLQVFPKYFNPATAKFYAGNPEKIANKIYANRMGNGDINSGDGWKFRGRGALQLTGKNNCQNFANYIGKTLDDTISYLETKEGALESALWFFKVNNLFDITDLKELTKRINGGFNGLSERISEYNRILAILS